VSSIFDPNMDLNNPAFFSVYRHHIKTHLINLKTLYTHLMDYLEHLFNFSIMKFIQPIT